MSDQCERRQLRQDILGVDFDDLGVVAWWGLTNGCMVTSVSFLKRPDDLNQTYELAQQDLPPAHQSSP